MLAPRFLLGGDIPLPHCITQCWPHCVFLAATSPPFSPTIFHSTSSTFLLLGRISHSARSTVLLGSNIPHHLHCLTSPHIPGCIHAAATVLQTTHPTPVFVSIWNVTQKPLSCVPQLSKYLASYFLRYLLHSYNVKGRYTIAPAYLTKHHCFKPFP